jgi:hypothetical protein
VDLEADACLTYLFTKRSSWRLIFFHGRAGRVDGPAHFD